MVQFVELMFRFAPNFDDYPKAKAILNSPDICLEDRPAQILIRLTEADIDQIVEAYDESAWVKSIPPTLLT